MTGLCANTDGLGRGASEQHRAGGLPTDWQHGPCEGGRCGPNTHIRGAGASRSGAVPGPVAWLCVMLAGLSCIVAGISGCGDTGGGDFAIQNIEPRVGATAGQQPITITGSGFEADVGYTVYFGNKKAGTVMIVDESTMAVATPEAEAPGPVDVTIYADNGPAFRVQQAFRYEQMAGRIEDGLGDPQQRKAKGALAY